MRVTIKVAVSYDLTTENRRDGDADARALLAAIKSLDGVAAVDIVGTSIDGFDVAEEMEAVIALRAMGRPELADAMEKALASRLAHSAAARDN